MNETHIRKVGTVIGRVILICMLLLFLSGMKLHDVAAAIRYGDFSIGLTYIHVGGWIVYFIGGF